MSFYKNCAAQPSHAIKECLRLSGECFADGGEALEIEHASMEMMEKCVTQARAYARKRMSLRAVYMEDIPEDDARALDAMYVELTNARKLMRLPIRIVDARMKKIHFKIKSCRLRLRALGECGSAAKEGIYDAIAKATEQTQSLCEGCAMVFGQHDWEKRIDPEFPDSDEACCELHKRIIDIAILCTKDCKKVMYDAQHRWDYLFHGHPATLEWLADIHTIRHTYDEMWADLSDAYSVLNDACKIIHELDTRIFLWMI